MNLFTDKIKQWMSDWADEFDQSWDEEKMAALVGKRIELVRPESEKADGDIREMRTFTLGVVGWSNDRLAGEEDGPVVNRWSVLTDEGNQIFIYAGSTVTVLEDSENDD